MAVFNSLQKAIERAKQFDSYWIEAAKIELSVAFEEKRKDSHMSYADLARKLNTSKAYISKVFRGDANLTIESMVKLARAMDCEVSITVGENINIGVVNPRFAVTKKPEPFKTALGSSKTTKQSHSNEYYPYLDIESQINSKKDKFLEAA